MAKIYGLTLATIKKVKTYEDLEQLGIGNVYCDISYRGGGVGFYGSDVARILDVSEGDLPGKYGAFCNYLGGGLRGSINESGFNQDLWNSATRNKARLLEELARACVRVYDYIDSESVENDVMQGVARVKGVKSAY